MNLYELKSYAESLETSDAQRGALLLRAALQVENGLREIKRLGFNFDVVDLAAPPRLPDVPEEVVDMTSQAALDRPMPVGAPAVAAPMLNPNRLEPQTPPVPAVVPPSTSKA